MPGSIADWLFGRGALKQAAGSKKAPPAPPLDPEAMRKVRQDAQKQADRDLKTQPAAPPKPKIPAGHTEVRNVESHADKLEFD